MRILIRSTIGATVLAAPPALAQTCGTFGSPSSIGGCTVPSRGYAPGYRIQSDPVRPGQFIVEPIQPPTPSIIPPPVPYTPYPAYPYRPLPQTQPTPRSW